MSNILVTGGLGFIGSNFIHSRLSGFPDTNILNLDSMSFGANPRSLDDLNTNSRYQFEKCNVTDAKKLSEVSSQIDVIVNFAAETHVDRSISNPEAFLESNVIGTHRLLEFARKRDVRKFVQISTDEVYGSAPSTMTFTEYSPLNPSSPYSASKAAADVFVMSYYSTYGLPAVILRCTNNFGPYQFPEKFIPKTIISCLLDREIPLYGDGSQVRDWIYVTDFCDAISGVVERGSIGAIYNVSAGNELPNVEVAKKILRTLKKPFEMIRFVEDRPGHDRRYSLNSELIREKLQWRPNHQFDEGLNATVNWYVSNENWWKPLLSDRILSATPWKEKW